MKEPLKFCLREDASTYFEVTGGIVNTSGTQKFIEESVVNASAFIVEFIRHDIYKGIYRKYTPDSCRLANDGAKITRFVHNTKGKTNAKLQLEVLRLKTTDQLYYPFVVCDIDFSQNYKSEEDYVYVQLMQSGMSATVNAFDSTKFAIEVGEPQGATSSPTGPIGPAVDIYMNGIPFIETFNFETVPNDVITVTSFAFERTIGITFIDQEDVFFKSQGSITVGAATSIPSGSQPINSSQNFFRSSRGTNMAVMDVNMDIVSIHHPAATGPTTAYVYVRMYDAAGTTVIFDEVIYQNTIPSGGTINPGRINHKFSYAEAGGAYLVFFLYSSFGGAVMTLGPTPGKISLTYNVKIDDSLIAAYSQWQLFQMLADNLICSNPVPAGTKFPLTMGGPGLVGYNNLPAAPVKSDLLTTSANYWDLDPTQTYFTSGNAIRNMQYLGNGTDLPVTAYIKTSMRDFVQDAFVSLCAGLGIETISGTEMLVLEHLSHFYQADVLIKDLGSEINKFSKEPYNEYLATNIKAGYGSNSYNDANGLWEYNTQVNFTTPAIREQNDMDLTSPYRTDSYGVELTRYSSTTSQTSDADSDSEVFKLQSDGIDAGIYSDFGFIKAPYNDLPYYPPAIHLPAKWLKRGHDAATMQGLPQIGVAFGVGYFVYNIPFTPKRNIYRLLPWFKSNYYGMLSPSLNFQESKRTVNLVSSFIGGSGVVDEWADVDLTSTGSDILYKPDVFSFEVVSPDDLVTLMEANPYGVFGFTERGVYMEGHVLQCGLKAGETDVYRFRLLCSKNTVVPDWL